MMAQAWSPPAETAVTPEDRAGRGVGVRIGLPDELPVPTVPTMFKPQHFRAPPVTMAHV